MQYKKTFTNNFQLNVARAFDDVCYKNAFKENAFYI